MIEDLPIYALAQSKEAAVRIQLNIPVGNKLTQADYFRIWGYDTSGRAVRGATLSGRGAQTFNDLTALGPSDPLYMRPDSIQAKIELATLARLGLVAGLVEVVGGTLQIASAVTKDTPDVLRPVAVIGGSLQITGGFAYAVGALQIGGISGVGGATMAAGGGIAGVGGLLAVPVGAAVILQDVTKALLSRWRDFSIQVVYQGFRNFQFGIQAGDGAAVGQGQR